MRRITLLLSFILAFASGWGQLSITSFKIKSNLPAEINSWSKDPASVLLVAIKIPLQKIDQVKLVIQIRSKGAIICGYQPQEVKAMDSSFALKALSASDLLGLMPKCAKLADGSYQLCARFFNADNKPISNESCKDFTVGNDQIKVEPAQVVTNYILNLVSPGKEAIISEANSKKPVQFSWQLRPESTNKLNISYRLHVHECIGNQTAEEAISKNPAVIDKLAQRTNGIIEYLPANAAGKKYAWTVEGTIAGVNGQKDRVLYSNDAWVFRVLKVGSDPGPGKPSTDKINYIGPKLKYPNNGAAMKATAINNLQLSWDIVSPKPKQAVTYRWFVFEMQGGRSVTDIVKNSYPIRQGSVRDVFFAPLSLPADAPGKTYAWTVQAVNDEGGAYGENNGYADPFVFSVQSGGKITGPGNPPGTMNIDCNIKIDNVIINCLGTKDNNGNMLYNICLNVDNYSIGGTIFDLNSVANPNLNTLVNIINSSNVVIKSIPGSDPSLALFPTQLIAGLSSLCFQTYLPPSLGSIYVMIKPYYKKNNDKCDNEVSSSSLTLLGPCPCEYCTDDKILVSEQPGLSVKNNLLMHSVDISVPGVQVKQFKAELIAFAYYAMTGDKPEEQCYVCNKDDKTFGNFTSGTFNNVWGDMPNGAFPVVSTGNTQHTLGWWGSPTIINNKKMVLNLTLPPVSTLSCCQGYYAYCIRYTFTDSECRTCSVVKCYQYPNTRNNSSNSKLRF